MKHWHWILSLSLLSSSLCLARSWTNQSGKTIEADFMKLDGENVVLLMKGKEYRIPVASLSEEDQAFAREEAERLAKEQAGAARKFMGQELVPGQLHEFDFDLSEENKKTAYRNAKVYISSGEKDGLVKPDSRKQLEDGCKDAGFGEVRSEIYDGGHSISHQQLGDALDWFLQ